MEATIRKARFDDIDRIVELWMEMMSDHHGFEPRLVLTANAAVEYRKYASYYIAHADSSVYVAELSNKEVVGYCLAFISQNLPMFEPETYGFISDLVVTEKQKRQGIGAALMSHVKQWFQRRAVKNIQLQVYSHNTAGKQFWKKIGFENFFERLWLDL